ncbi:type III restriction-modification system endonuclease [Nonomuraea fuscirosea]|uniref:type III restriction-modification system endonuclease n=1 Tax=Nonomuraea fuscirosea TaxID=1291556 RepID=UPI003411A913
MKLHFEADLDYQRAAIDAVCGLFKGQENCRSEFTVVRESGSSALFGVSDLGIGNRLNLIDDEILSNLQEIQKQNGLVTSAELTSGNFTVEMETGTGKTYVYLRTIFELNQKYGFTKFVIVVPSVAIKEGVYKSLQIMEEHFATLYDGVPFEYFLYDSGKLGLVRNFATSSQIQIMVTTVGAINKKDVNNLYKDSEKLGGERPIDLIKATRPILIVDEPQSVDGGLKGAGKTALSEMHPLCTLRYSATHVDKHHMVYRLDAVDAYQQKLVKQIEVAAATVQDGHNRPYVRLLSTSNKHGVITARVELDVDIAGHVQRRVVTVQDGDSLKQTTNRAVYQNCAIGEIRAAKGGEYVELRVPGGEQFLRPGQAWGDVDPLAVQTELIRRTILEHLRKEQRLRRHGIKVLSLFFIDSVERYRAYDADGNEIRGVYAEIFEREYKRAARRPEFQTLFDEVDLDAAAEEVHDGYFSIDRKSKRAVDTSESNASGTASAEDAYNLIMRDKEQLLSYDTPLKFIFSHSALREGWDNPNVFQICTLREMGSERERRQTIGRGLRLCVNQQGERVRGFEYNTLTVIATESYEEFAENLQKEIEADTGIRFGVIRPDEFAAIVIVGDDGQAEQLGAEKSRLLVNYLKAEGYVDGKGRVQDSLRHVLKDGALSVPEPLQLYLPQITEVIKKLAGRLEIKNADERRSIKARKEVLYSEDFKALWDRIKHRTTYRVQFDNEKLLNDCTDALLEAPPIPKTRLQWRKADLSIGQAGVLANVHTQGADTVALNESDIELPDLLTDLQNRTHLTRRSIHRIVVKSGRLNDFRRNPQLFIEQAAEAINRCKQLALVDGIKYERIGDSEYSVQELFEAEELTGYLKSMLSDVQKSVMESILYDSLVEKGFAEDLEANDRVKVYTKLPRGFKVPTPLGFYNPDWAILMDTEDGEKLYLVVETKGGLLLGDLRDKESAKIECGKAHFKAIAIGDNPAQFRTATSVEDILT